MQCVSGYITHLRLVCYTGGMSRPTRIDTAAETRRAVLTAANSLFLHNGFARTTVDAIAREAGYTRGAFYAHFTSKDDVLLSVVTSMADQATPIILKRVEACITPDQVLRAVADWAAERSQSQDIALLMLEATRIAGPGLDALPSLFAERWAVVGDVIARFFPDRDPSISTDEIVAIVVGLTYGPVGSGLTGHDAGRLVAVALKALMSRQVD